jgi:P-type conjugative transfer protein TrbG
MKILLPLALVLAPGAVPSAPAAPAARPAGGAPVAASQAAPPDPRQAATAPLRRYSHRHRQGSARWHGPSSLGKVRAANRAATREPLRTGFAGAAQVYAWTEGSLYRLYTAPERVSDIALQPGEALLSVAAGDTVRWVIGDTASGTGSARRVHILVKPSAPGLATNLVIMTDRRVYHVQLESVADGAMAGIAWTYAEDALLAVRAGEGVTAAAASQDKGLALDRLSFRYRIEGDDPPWRPLRAFDDGRQVFIEFSEGMRTSEAPPLFVTDGKGAAELVNYRVRDRYYVVDRLFAAAELRLGAPRQQVVRILRTDAPRAKRRGKRA